MQVVWRPFLLDPHASRDGISKLDAYTRKFGAERARAILSPTNPMVKQFKDAGVTLTFDGLTGSTFDAHRLVAHAEHVGGVDMQNELMEQLFRAYFERAQFVGSEAVLLDAAERAGVPDARRVTDDASYMKKEVEEQLSKFAARVRGVPHFIVDGGKTIISGAQPTDTWAEIFELAAERAGKA